MELYDVVTLLAVRLEPAIELGEPTIADAILDRLVHNAHRIELRGESLRKPEDGSERATASDQPDERTKTAERPKRGETRAAETA